MFVGWCMWIIKLCIISYLHCGKWTWFFYYKTALNSNSTINNPKGEGMI